MACWVITRFWPTGGVPAKIVSPATILSALLNSLGALPSTRIGAILAKLDLFRFVPFRLNRLAAEVSSALASEYQQRYGLDIPEWRVLATLGFRNDACSAQYISHCTRTHKSTISRAVTALMARQLIERIENTDDRREFKLRLTRKGAALYQKLIPRLLRREQEILSCLSAQERKDFARVLAKIEKSLGLVQTSTEATLKALAEVDTAPALFCKGA